MLMFTNVGDDPENPSPLSAVSSQWHSGAVKVMIYRSIQRVFDITLVYSFSDTIVPTATAPRRWTRRLGRRRAVLGKTAEIFVHDLRGEQYLAPAWRCDSHGQPHRSHICIIIVFYLIGKKNLFFFISFILLYIHVPTHKQICVDISFTVKTKLFIVQQEQNSYC